MGVWDAMDKQIEQAYEEMTPRFKMVVSPSAEIASNLKSMGEAFLHLAVALVVETPSSRELSTALTHLEVSKFWASAAIVRNGLRTDDD